MAFPLIPLATGIGSLIGNLFNAGQNTAQSNLDRAQQNANVDKTIAANRELADLQFRKNEEMWVKNNAYNSPSEQMARLKLAGLNPNLVYGNGAVGNASGAIPQYQAPKESYDYQAPDVRTALPSAIMQFQDMQMRQAQTDNVKAQTEATRVKTSNDMIQGRILGLREYGMPFDNAVKSAKAKTAFFQEENASTMSKYQLQALQQGAKRSQLTNDKIFQDILFRTYQNDWMRAGVTGSDNFFIRALSRGAGGANVKNVFSMPFEKLGQYFSKPKK